MYVNYNCITKGTNKMHSRRNKVCPGSGLSFDFPYLCLCPLYTLTVLLDEPLTTDEPAACMSLHERMSLHQHERDALNAAKCQLTNHHRSSHRGNSSAERFHWRFSTSASSTVQHTLHRLHLQSSIVHHAVLLSEDATV